MPSIRDTLQRWLRRPAPQGPAPDVEALRLAFQARYHQFKLLLNANNKALELMSEIEAALSGTQAFGMTFVRSRLTRISTSVFAVVRHMNELAPGGYGALFERFKAIQHEINPHVRIRETVAQGPLVIPLGEVRPDMADQVGAKMANLAEICRRVELAPPEGFVVTAAGFARFMTHSDLQTEIARLLQTADIQEPDELYALSARIQQLIVQAEVPGDLVRAMTEACQALSGEDARPPTLAVRSSALGEDEPGTSFAGQYRSELNVNPEHLLQAYKTVVASKYGVTAMSYRLTRGIREEDVAMCVGCMRMIEARSAGVLYTRSPLDPRNDDLTINAAWGLPKSVVDGSVASDLFVVRRGPPLAIGERQVRDKQRKFVCYPDEGVCRLDTVAEERLQPSLNDDQILALARVGLAIDAIYAAAQDIEWAIDARDRLHLLQCRPLPQTPPAGESSGPAGNTAAAPLVASGGQTASAGVAAGPVYVVRKDADALGFPSGAVLVAAQALPRWAPMLSRAAAVVTEQGSIAGHLANVAREFEVPAIVGLEGAVERLGGQATVTVDAGSRSVYAGRIETLLGPGAKPRNLMAGSPVYAALRQAAEHVIPLTLLDPDSPNFTPENCRTFHDLTRFCHEKAVHEMFRFGKDHAFPERSSKQLHAEVPMQWWVLNLDDGLAQETEGPYAHLDNIVSIPMRALWEGITAYPWEGPPPVDGRGMMAVMFQATANRSLVPTVRTRFANRNYFMISRHYCSLQSRLGFHFCTVEALVSERRTENYASFRFKGGAADLARRIQRVAFVGALLEPYGFQVALREDALAARIEQYDQPVMCDALRLLGYLIIHTRQLDMIMAAPNSVAFYRRKLEDQIARLLTVIKPSPLPAPFSGDAP
jgi:pyruvate,water dikinase